MYGEAPQGQAMPPSMPGPGPVPPQGGPQAGPNPLMPEAWTDPVIGASSLMAMLNNAGIPPPLVLQGFAGLAQGAAQPPPPPGAPGAAPGPAVPPGANMNQLFGP